ncbi:MAG: hypothetical protein FWD32_00320 [Firmicutes bacterium]|nr:hypothetical protein [Bacillota bacterium]
MKTIALRFFNFLKSTQMQDLLMKMAGMYCVMLVSLFWQPALFVLMAFIVIVIIFEKSIKSLYHIMFLLPFQAVFAIGTNLILFIYIFEFFSIYHFILFLIKNNKNVFKDKIFILLCVILGYILIAPIFNGLDYFTHNLADARAYFLISVLFIVYLVYKNHNQLCLKHLVYFLSLGLIISSLIAVFAQFTRIADFVAVGDNSWNKRFFGLMPVFNNLNVFHMFVLCAIFGLLACVIKKQINLCQPNTILLLIALTVLGLLTASRAFYISFLLLIITIVISIFINKASGKEDNKKRQLLVVGICVLVAVLLSFTHVHYLFSRLGMPNIDSGGVIEHNARLSNIKRLGSPSNVGTHIYDPGRAGLMLRYLESWASSFTFAVFGHGFGINFPYPTLSPHNMWIYLLWCGGLLGFLLIVAFGVMVITGAFKKQKSKENILVLLMAALCFGALSLVESMVSNYSFLTMLIVIVLGLTTTAKNQEEQIENTTPEEVS